MNRQAKRRTGRRVLPAEQGVSAGSVRAAANGADLDSDAKHLLRQLDIPERTIRRTIATLVVCFAVVGAVAATSREASQHGWRGIVLVTVLVSTFPVGAFIGRMALGRQWWAPGDGGTARHTTLFIVYADVGVTAVLVTFTNYEAMLYGTGLFAVVGTYVGAFARRKTIRFHLGFTSTLIVTLAVLAYRQGTYDAGGVAARALVSLLAAASTVGMLNGFSLGVQRSMRVQFHEAVRDPLTGLLNRRGLQQWVAAELGNRAGSFGVALIDVDRFKMVNDVQGHAAGDAVLTRLGGRLRDFVGTGGVVARTGGEEFVAVVSNADQTEILRLTTQLLAVVYEPEDDIPITVSIGLSLSEIPLKRTDFDPAGLFGHNLVAADAALYTAKVSGRNRVVAVVASPR